MFRTYYFYFSFIINIINFRIIIFIIMYLVRKFNKFLCRIRLLIFSIFKSTFRTSMSIQMFSSFLFKFSMNRTNYFNFIMRSSIFYIRIIIFIIMNLLSFFYKFFCCYSMFGTFLTSSSFIYMFWIYLKFSMFWAH